MTPAERWEPTDDEPGCIVVQGTTEPVAIVGDPWQDMTPADLRRAPIIVAAPELLEALEALLIPLLAASDDGVKVDPADMQATLRNACAAVAKASPRPVQMDSPFDGRGTGVPS